MLRDDLILLVDASAASGRALVDALRENQFWVEQARTVRQALDQVRVRGASLVILDLELPDGDGLELCQELAGREVPFLVQSARTDLATRLAAFACGADDVIAKPCHPLELVARVRAVLRRCRGAQETAPPAYRHHDLVLDAVAHRVELDGQTLHLTPTEFRLLRALLEAPSRVFTRDELLGQMHTFDAPAGSDRSVDLHVASLRRKLGDNPKTPRYIEAVRGVGYRLALAPAPPARRAQARA
ncbi:MAG: response regulator transcription factor [Chloroflexi bacterium]|nr:response regulator transcription factor [Chloroflexota bacterium]